MALDLIQAVTLGIIVGTLASIIYSLRVLVLMERRVARIETHIEALVTQVLQKETEIANMLRGRKKAKRKR